MAKIDDDVEVADAVHADAVSLAEQTEADYERLHNSFIEGDEVTPEDLGKAESLSRFAKLNIERTKRLAEKARDAAADKAAKALKVELVADESSERAQIVDLVKSLFETATKIQELGDGYNQRIIAWSNRARELGAETDGPATKHGIQYRNGVYVLSVDGRDLPVLNVATVMGYPFQLLDAAMIGRAALRPSADFDTYIASLEA